jgi:hypothetical protein
MAELLSSEVSPSTAYISVQVAMVTARKVPANSARPVLYTRRVSCPKANRNAPEDPRVRRAKGPEYPEKIFSSWVCKTTINGVDEPLLHTYSDRSRHGHWTPDARPAGGRWALDTDPLRCPRNWARPLAICPRHVTACHERFAYMPVELPFMTRTVCWCRTMPVQQQHTGLVMTMRALVTPSCTHCQRIVNR